MNTTLTTQDVVIPRCPTPQNEIKSNLTTSAATGENSHDSKLPNAQVSPELGSHNSETGKALHSTAGMGDELAKNLQQEIAQINNSPELETAPRKTIFNTCSNLLTPVPVLKNIFETYAHDKKLNILDEQGIKTKISLLSNQVSVFSNLISLIIPNKPAFEGINKAIDFISQYSYRSMIGISAFAKFTKVAKNNDLIASIMSFTKTIFAFNAQHILSFPLKALGIKANLNLPFENFYSWLGFTNGPMNISSAAANTRMGKDGYKNIGESLSIFTEQITDTIDNFKQAAAKGNIFSALNPENGVGAHGTLGGVLQLTGFFMKQAGLMIKEKNAGLGNMLEHSGSMLRNNIACWLTDIERFSIGNMMAGKVESVASGTNYSIEGILDELQQQKGINRVMGKQIRALMGLFGTWAAATNAAGVHEENKDFQGKPLLTNANPFSYLRGMLEATIKANLGHSLPKSILKIFSKPAADENRAPQNNVVNFHSAETPIPQNNIINFHNAETPKYLSPSL